MNIVVQQSGGAKNAQNIRHATQEHNHLVATQQKEKDIQQQTTIQQSEDAEQAKPDKDLPDRRKKKRHSRRRLNIEESEALIHEFKGSGKLLDTVV